MNEAINKVIELAVANYTTFVTNADFNNKEESVANFRENFEVRKGKKYYKIISGNSVWGFVVAVDNDKKFRKGDLLKPASFAAPARNAARGNVLDGLNRVGWTGPAYL